MNNEKPGQDYTCRVLGAADFGRFQDLLYAICQEEGDESQSAIEWWQGRFDTPDYKVFGLFHARDLAGYAYAKLVAHKKTVYFGDLHILKPHRGRGLSRILYKEGLKYADRKSLSGDFDTAAVCVGWANIPSRRLAMQYGFNKVGIIDRLEGEGNILLYQRPLSKGSQRKRPRTSL